MSEVTQILFQIEKGDLSAADKLLPLVYNELRKLAAAKMAQEKPGQTLQATALVHEAYLKLVEGARVQVWESRGHFFAAAAEAMRRILVDNAHRKKTLKRGGDHQRVGLTENEPFQTPRGDDLLALDEALDELARQHPHTAELVKLRYFAGLTVSEAAEVLNISPRKANGQWLFAKAWLHERICRGEARN